MQYIHDYEHGVAHAAKKQGLDGVICGHIHHPAIKRIGEIDYYNTGDWVESCSALCEDSQGQMQLLFWDTAKKQPSAQIKQAKQTLEQPLKDAA
jgi:UDP-2,3-diacylglucosamine pyrophosphatase LpxH